MTQEAALVGDFKIILEQAPHLADDEVIVPLEGLSLLLLGRSLYPTKNQSTVWRKEVELYLRTLLLPGFEYGQSLEQLCQENPGDYASLAKFAISNSTLRQYGLYGPALVEPAKLASLGQLRGEPITRNAESKFAGATSLAQTLKSLRDSRPPLLKDDEIGQAVLYPTNAEALKMGEVLTHLCQLARHGVPEALHSFEKMRDVKGVVWDCFEGVYTRASVKVKRSFLEAVLKAFCNRTLRLDYALFLPLYQIVYARDKSLPELQPSLGTWLSMFGAQGSETSYKPHVYSRHIEREGKDRFYPFGEEYPFFLTHLGVDHKKYDGIYLCYRDPGNFVVGENSFIPGNFEARAFLLGEELRGIEKIFFPSLSPKFRGRAFNQLVCPNPITKTKLKTSHDAKLGNEFTALKRGLENCQGKWSETLSLLAFDACKAWASERDKSFLFRNFTEFDVVAAQVAEKKQLPDYLKAPLQKVETDDEKRQAYNQTFTPQKAVDTMLNVISQTVLCEINNNLGGIFSGYLPGTTPLNVASDLLEAVRKNKNVRLMNVDVAKAFDSIDLLTYKEAYQDWLQRCDQVARTLCSHEQADILKNIFFSFCERVQEGFYAGEGVEPGKTPLGLSLGPSFWVYLSLPLAKTFADAKAKGDCLFATITGDDSLAVLKKEAEESSLWSTFEDFSKLGFRYHFFKNFELSYDPEHPVTTKGAFSSEWSPTVPIVHAGIMIHRQLIYATSKLESVTEGDLAKQARFGLVRFPTNLLRIVHNRKTTGLSKPDVQLSNYDTSSSLDVLLDKLPRGEAIKMLEPTTHGGLLYFNEKRLLNRVDTPQEEDKLTGTSQGSESDIEMRAKAALAYHSFFKTAVKNGDPEALVSGLRDRILLGFPRIKEELRDDVQAIFGDCEAVALQTLMDIDPSFRFRSNHGRKIRIAVGRSKCHDYNHSSYYSKSLVVPLTRLALENPELIFTRRQRELAREGQTLGPRFSIKKHDETISRSGQALQVLSVSEDGTITVPSINLEVLKALATMNNENIDWAKVPVGDSYIQRKATQLYERLHNVDKIRFRKLVKGHIRRCKQGEKTFRQELREVLNGQDNAWEAVHQAWKQSDLVRLLLKG